MNMNIFVVGASGAGKSTSLRNLNPERTIILNTERKRLPFRGAGNFKMQMMVSNLTEFQESFPRALLSDKADVVVVDSFTTLSEQVLHNSRQIRTGFDIWSGYAEDMYGILQSAKEIGDNKYVVFLGIDEPLQDDTGVITRAVRVDGKAMKGSIEKEFTAVLWAKVLREGDEIKHVFETNNDGSTTAKTPMEMFDERFIDNDLNRVLNTMKEYYA